MINRLSKSVILRGRLAGPGTLLKRTQVISHASETARVRVTDWDGRRQRMMIEDIVSAGKRAGRIYLASELEEGVLNLRSILGDSFSPNLETMKAADWGIVLLDPDGVAKRLIALKMAFPSLNLSNVVTKKPSLLLKSVEDIERDANGTKKLLANARDIESLIEQLPDLLNPKTCLSILLSIQKWYNGRHSKEQKDPVAILEGDPDLVYRAQAMDQPFEPVYENEDGTYQAGEYLYRERRADWQAYIDRTRYGQP